ncbi:hypothetical protein JAAARDRAFT_63599 [Jaapia argillacea MUCL 33604]|uniref:F-box domain-containing protein n=1 Tax=Jaapia argillacea MUCL 33604 TaxID=933084 RepID=A0A067PGQ0_9AGAM|nr:hypothetical protein JAAARDRAFT_63599 [Jaapia argillacea MUCL 33604]
MDEARFLEALRLMTRLWSFGFQWFDPCKFREEGFNAIWEILQYCPNLCILNVVELLYSLPNDTILNNRDTSLHKLHNIESFDLSTICLNPTDTHTIPTTYLATFLSTNPLLQVLDLSFNGPYLPFAYTFAQIHLPNLSSLRISRLAFHSEILCLFLRRNSSIRYLSLVDCTPAPQTTSLFHHLQHNDLPNLKYFLCHGTEWIPLCNAKPPLSHLHGISPEILDDEQRRRAVQALRCVVGTLRGIVVFRDTEDEGPLDVGWIEEVVPGVVVSRQRR